jgi:hypothetical protein
MILTWAPAAAIVLWPLSRTGQRTLTRHSAWWARPAAASGHSRCRWPANPCATWTSSQRISTDGVRLRWTTWHWGQAGRARSIASTMPSPACMSDGSWRARARPGPDTGLRWQRGSRQGRRLLGAGSLHLPLPGRALGSCQGRCRRGRDVPARLPGIETDPEGTRHLCPGQPVRGYGAGCHSRFLCWIENECPSRCHRCDGAHVGKEDKRGCTSAMRRPLSLAHGGICRETLGVS